MIAVAVLVSASKPTPPALVDPCAQVRHVQGAAGQDQQGEAGDERQARIGDLAREHDPAEDDQAVLRPQHHAQRRGHGAGQLHGEQQQTAHQQDQREPCHKLHERQRIACAPASSTGPSTGCVDAHSLGAAFRILDAPPGAVVPRISGSSRGEVPQAARAHERELDRRECQHAGRDGARVREVGVRGHPTEQRCHERAQAQHRNEHPGKLAQRCGVDGLEREEPAAGRVLRAVPDIFRGSGRAVLQGHEKAGAGAGGKRNHGGQHGSRARQRAGEQHGCRAQPRRTCKRHERPVAEQREPLAPRNDEHGPASHLQAEEQQAHAVAPTCCVADAAGSRRKRGSQQEPAPRLHAEQTVQKPAQQQHDGEHGARRRAAVVHGRIAREEQVVARLEPSEQARETEECH